MVEAGDRDRSPWSWAQVAWSRVQGVSTAVVIGAMATALGYVWRVWVRGSAPPLVWNDTADYLASASTPLWSADRLLGPRPVLMPLAISAVQHDLVRLVELHDAAAALAWGLLAGVVAGCFDRIGRQLLAACAVLALSLAWPISMWDQQVLTESLALTTFALLAAAGVWFARRPSGARGALLVGAASLWLLARDSHVVPVALLGIGLVVVGWIGWVAPRRVIAITGAYLVAVAFLVAGSAQYGHRDRIPIEHVYEVRILPHPERVAWFAAHGMPQAQALGDLPVVIDPTGRDAPHTYVDPSPTWSRWRADGRRALLAYAATHPGYVWSEPTRDPERVYNNGDGLATYRPLELNEVPFLATVAAPSVAVTLAAGLLALLVMGIRRVPWGPLATAGAVIVATSGPHALVVWHSDGMESARHLLVPTVQLRTGVLLLVLVAVLGRPAVPRRAPVAPPSEVERTSEVERA